MMPSLLILYGSETGNAQDVAERIGRVLIAKGKRARVLSMDLYPIADLVDESVTIFVCSTTGNGVEPRTMSPLWNKFIRSDLPEDLLSEMSFGVFGLGDSGYERFNWAAKKLQRRLLGLGATKLLERGDADDRDPYGLYSVLDLWLARLLEALSDIELEPKSFEDTKPLPNPRVRLKLISDVDVIKTGMKSLRIEHPSRHVAKQCVKVKRNARTTPSHWYQDVRAIELESQDSFSYEPGDVAVLYPENSDSDVDRMIARLGLEDRTSEVYTIEPSNSDWPLPSDLPGQTSLRDLFRKYLDIASVPRRTLFEWIRLFATDDNERERLEEFSSKEGQDDLYSYVNRPRRTIIEVLEDFRSVKIPLEYILDCFPLIKPRRFSIASAAQCHPHQIHLCIAIVQYKTILRSPRKGLCTSWLTRLPVGTEIDISIEEGTMRLPVDVSKPVVLVGPGTGIAPLRSFVEERIRRGAKTNLLFFGCRSRSADCHYHDEWETYQARGDLIFRLATSRDQEDKLYVQHLISKETDLIFDYLVQQGGSVFISGSSNQMPKAVRKAVEGCLAIHEGWDNDKAALYVRNMELDGRWGEECWS